MISDGKTNELYKSLGSAYLEVCQQQRDAIIDDDKDRWNLEEKDSYDTVAAVVDYDRSKKGSEDATYDSDHGKKKEAKKERDYAAWERGKMKKDDPNWKHKKGHTGMHGEEYMPEAMRPGERQRKIAAKVHDPYASSKTKAIAHNVAVRNDGPGTPGYQKKSTGGKGERFPGYGDQGAGNKARRRAGEEPMRGNQDPRPKKESYRGMTVGEILAEGIGSRIGTAATNAGRNKVEKAKEGNPNKLVGSGKNEKLGATIGGALGGVAGAAIPDGPLMVAGELAGGYAGSKIGGKLGRQFDKKDVAKSPPV